MKKVLLLTTIGVVFLSALSYTQNVFNPNDLNRRWVNNGTSYSNDSTAYTANPNPNLAGLQKWVSVKTNGIDSSSWGKDMKAYFINFNGVKMAFRIMYPTSYNNPDSAGKKYPVMLFFHGAGEPGCSNNGGVYNNEKQMVHGGKTFHDRVKNGQFDGFLLYPQLVVTSGTCWSDWGNAFYSPNYYAVFGMIDSLAKYARLDIDRVFTDGLSNGGSACWSTVAAYPQRIAKSAISSWADEPSNYSDYIHIPVWFATGGKDTSPAPTLAASVYNNLSARGMDIRYTLYPDLGHGTWNTHWAEPDFVPYMNDVHKANPLVYFQRYDYCPDSAINARIGITPGFYAYEWQKDGVTIATRTNGVNTIVDGTSIISYTGNEVTVNAFGTYRVHFKRTASSAWSDWSPKPAVIYPKTITVTPPITVVGNKSNVLPAPDGSTTVPLQLPSGYYGYQWVRVSDNAVVSNTNTYTAPVGQYKAKIIEQFGCGTLFSPIFSVISAAGTPKPESAKNLTATGGPTSIQLDWNENPNAGENETGYEIYRSATSGGPYSLIHTTAPDVITYTDPNLPSAARYYYIIRAIGNFGAAGNSNEATAITQTDDAAPTAPSGLFVTCVTRTKITIKWNASTDNIGVTAYDVYVNGTKAYSTEDTRLSMYELTPFKTYSIVVKAHDAAGNVSQPSNQVNPSTYAQGLCYTVYAGTWDALPDFNTLTPIAEGMSTTGTDVSLRPSGLNDYFAMKWEGTIFNVKLPNESSMPTTRRFRICSDDGSKMFFNSAYSADGAATLNDDGLHGITTCATMSSGNVVNMPANTGFPITYVMFEKNGGEGMESRWLRGNSGSTYDIIPASAYSETFSPGGTAPAAPSGLAVSTVNYSKLNLTWNDNSNNETGFEVVRSTTSGGTYVPVATVTGNSYTDSNLNAATTYYYKVRSVGQYGQSAFTSFASGTTAAAPAAPAAPDNLVPQVAAKDIIDLTWNDNSSNETGFEVWRSVGNNTSYRLLTTVPGGAGATKSYVDSGLFANITYYYKVRATGAVNPSGYSPEANATTANTKPVMNAIYDFSMQYGTTYALPVSATDADGDLLTFSFDNLPYFASPDNVSNGNLNLVLTPQASDQGAYTISAYVDDGHLGRDTAYFTIVVNYNSVPALDTLTGVNMDEGETVVKALKANDSEGNNYISWYVDNMPSWAQFVDSGNGRGSITLHPNYAASGTYSLTVYADDGNGAWTSRSFNVNVADVDPNETIRVNMKYFLGNVAGWNDVDLFNLPKPFNVANLRNSRNEVTTVGINALSSNYFGNVNGVQTGNNSGPFPDAIMRDYVNWGFFDTGVNDTLRMRVYGLDPEKRYNFIFYGGTTNNCCGVTSNSVTKYLIGNSTAQVHYYLNSSETDTIYQAQPNGAGEIVITMVGDATGNLGGLLNAMVIDAAIDDGSTPAAPTNLEGEFVENSGVELNWTDRSYNEFQYNIYRAESQAGPYTYIGTVVKDSTHFVDNTTHPFIRYYYYVVGNNNHGDGGTSDTINVLTGNNRPHISALVDMLVKSDAVGQQNFTVTDDPGETIAVSIVDKPDFVTLSDLGGGNYRITASPSTDVIGQHQIEVKAVDNYGGESTSIITLTVADKNTRSIMVNFGQPAYSASAPWNNFTGGGGAGMSIANLRDENNVATSIGMSLVNGWSLATNGTGQITGNNSGVVPDAVLISGLAYDATTARTITITGLDNSKRYNIVVIGSQNEGYDASARYTVNVSGEVDTLNARNNTNQTANLNGLTPSGGSITLSCTKLSSAGYMYLNAIILEEYDPSITLMNPINLYVEPKDRTTTLLSWSDRSNNENLADGFQLQRATDSMFTQNVANFNMAAGASTYTNGSLTPNTRYWYRIRSKNGSTYSDWSNRVKTITPASMVFVNFNYNVPNAGFPWNNLEAVPEPPYVFTDLKNQDGFSTGYDLNITRGFNGENNAGQITGNNSGMGGLVPDNTLQSSFWIDNTQESQIVLKGLNQAKRYRIGFIASSNWLGGNLTTTLTINGRTVYINAWQNTSKIVYIGNLVPDENSELLLTFSTTEAAGNGYNSGIIIESYDDVPGGGTVLNTVNINQLVNKTVTEGTVASEDRLEGVNVYPNPFRDNINIDFNNSSAANRISVDVYDVTGRLVMRKDYGTLSAGYNTLRVNTADDKLGTGVYLVILSSNGKAVYSSKMIRTQ